MEGDHSVQANIVTYARQKLLSTSETKLSALKDDQHFACLAVRLPLDFNETLRDSESMDFERRQIESHMRICLGISDYNEKILSISPSEPILVDAAISAMEDVDFDASAALLRQLKKPGLGKGDRGELVSMLLLLLARDKLSQKSHTSAGLPVVDFLKALFNKKHHQMLHNLLPTDSHRTQCTTSLAEAFKDSYCYFTHFIKVTDYQVINADFLWRIMLRDGAVLCADNQRGIDIIIPLCWRGKKLASHNTTAIVIQCRNVLALSHPNRAVFDAMHPVELGILSEDNPLPVIRLVLSLGTLNSSVVTLPTPEKPGKPRTAKKAAKGYGQAYDIFASGPSSDTFAVIEETQKTTYEQLLKIHRVFPAAYTEIWKKLDSETPEEMSRSMYPGGSADAKNFASYIKKP